MSDADPADRDARISRRAYELWEQEGGEHGRHDDHWHRAAAEHDGSEPTEVAGAQQVAVAAPDGTMLSVPVDEKAGDAGAVGKRASPKAKTQPVAGGATKPPAKPRKPKAK